MADQVNPSHSFAARMLSGLCIVALLLIGTLQVSHFHREPAPTGKIAVWNLVNAEHSCLLCVGSMQASQLTAKMETTLPPAARAESLPAKLPTYASGVVLAFRIRPPPSPLQLLAT